MGLGRSGVLLMLFAVGLGGCADSNKSDAFALYRNSPMDYSMRVHWATFDAKDKGSYNMNNCLMAARLLNANVTASARAEGKERDVKAGFWCEAGPYKETGLVPTNFPEAFPTDV